MARYDLRMAPKIKPIPEGYHCVTALLTLRNTREAIAFYKKAFGAKDIGDVMTTPDGLVVHAEIQIGDSRIMLADENPQAPTKSPQTLGAATGAMQIYVEDVDTVFTQALAAGATVVFALANQFYGDRSGRVVDPFGHQWLISSHVEDVTPEEMKKRMAMLYG